MFLAIGGYRQKLKYDSSAKIMNNNATAIMKNLSLPEICKLFYDEMSPIIIELEFSANLM